LAIVGVLVMWPFVFDTFVTLVRRLLYGDNVFTAHRTHIYQRLVQTGLTHSQVTLLYGIQSFAGAAVACAMIWNNMTPWLAVIVLAAGSALSWQLLRARELRVRHA
jgi:Fuc2NAc and GlcNAc transferase